MSKHLADLNAVKTRGGTERTMVQPTAGRQHVVSQSSKVTSRDLSQVRSSTRANKVAFLSSQDAKQ